MGREGNLGEAETKKNGLRLKDHLGSISCGQEEGVKTAIWEAALPVKGDAKGEISGTLPRTRGVKKWRIV